MAADVGDSTIEDLDRRIAASREVRRPHEGQWLLNLAYFVGNQWLRFDGLRLYEYLPEDDSEPLIVDNRIQPAVRSEIAKLTKTMPAWVGVPKDGTDTEVSAARLRQRVFEHYWRVLWGRAGLRRVLQWSRVATAGFEKYTWDPTAGQCMRVMARVDPNTGELVNVKMTDGRLLTPKRLQEAGMSGDQLDGLQERELYTGDVRRDLRTPFEAFPDALATEDGLESCEWIGEEAVHSRDKLIRLFGEKAEGLQANAQPITGIAESRAPGSAFGVQRRGGAGYRGIRVREYWSLPNVDHAQGRHVVWVPAGGDGNGTILLEEPNPYPWLPYVMYMGTPVPGRFWGDCMVTQGVPQQTQLNKLESQIAANGERIGNPPLARSVESLDEENEWHGLPGEELIFRDMGTPGSVPAFLDVPELPAYVQNQREGIESSFREIFRQYEVSTGTVPAGVTAASAIGLLQESGDTVLGPDIGDVEDSLTQAGRRVLGIVKLFASNDRIARVAGEDGDWDFVHFRGDQLGSCDLDEVQIGSGVPESKAAKQAAISQMLNLLIQNGQPLKPRDMRRVLRDFQIGGLDHLIAGVNKDEEQIQDENRRLVGGEGLDQPQPVFQSTGMPLVGPDGNPLLAGMPVNPFDNDEQHIEGHEELCKSPVYRELQAKPGGQLIAQGILAHVELHRTRLAERAANLGQAGAGQDPPPPPPTPTSNGASPPQSAVAS